MEKLQNVFYTPTQSEEKAFIIFFAIFQAVTAFAVFAGIKLVHGEWTLTPMICRTIGDLVNIDKILVMLLVGGAIEKVATLLFTWFSSLVTKKAVA